MKSLMLAINRFAREEDGVTAVEYALLAAVIALVAAVGGATLGTELSAFFTSISTYLKTVPVP